MKFINVASAKEDFCHSEPAFFAGEESAVGSEMRLPAPKKSNVAKSLILLTTAH
jgi:hypothetical protein